MLVVFLSAFVLGVIAVLALLPLARRLHWVDHPDGARKDHRAPTPVVGGLAIALAVVPVALIFSLDGGDLRAVLALLSAGLLMLVVGLADDLHDLDWRWRISAQFVAALILIYGGQLAVNQVGTLFGYAVTSLGWLSVPFTVFVIVALINALNMADGVDGLSGGVVLVCVSMFAAAAFYSGDPALGMVLLATAGAVLAFAAFNLRRPGMGQAKLFLGNGGSALLGLVIAWASLRLSQNPAHPVTAVLLPWLLVPPVVDAVALTIRRVLKGRSPFAADRDHMHHLMLDAGFTPSAIALVLSFVTLVCGGAAALALRYDWLGHSALVAAYVVMTIAWFLLSYRRERAVACFAALRGCVPFVAKQRRPSRTSQAPARAHGQDTTVSAD